MLPPGADPNAVQATYENGGELRRGAVHFFGWDMLQVRL